MEDFHPLTSGSWSALSTIRSIDMGPGFSKDIIPRCGEGFQTNARSLFIESLIDQLCKLLEKDPHKRRKIYNAICSKLFDLKLVDKTYQLEELSSLRGYYQHAMMNVLRSPDPSVYKTSLHNLEWSRYYSEYEEINFIAAGGFGKVYKAKHRLDQVYYAVKKISVKLQNISLLIMGSNEVKTLAKLNHPNIVQYKAAWLEPMFYTSPALPDTIISHSSDSEDIIFQDSNSSLSNEGNIVTAVGNEEEKKLMPYKYKNDFGENEYSPSKQISATLYVSMQLCDETLREWLNKRNAQNKSIDIPLCMEIMIQATKGLEYIHSCNIVHHDIKPSNIFLSNSLRNIQVGDFGLACCLQGLNHSGCPLEGGRFGTRLYAAPEQHRGQCNPKSDMYSLGLVFIELLSVFATEMERINILSKCRSGDVPFGVPEQFVPIIKKMILPNADERPSSTVLLNKIYKLLPKPSDSKASLSVTKTQLISINENNRKELVCQSKDCKTISTCEAQEMLKIKEKEINELKMKLAKQESEIAELKKQIVRESS